MCKLALFSSPLFRKGEQRHKGQLWSLHTRKKNQHQAELHTVKNGINWSLLLLLIRCIQRVPATMAPYFCLRDITAQWKLFPFFLSLPGKLKQVTWQSATILIFSTSARKHLRLLFLKALRIIFYTYYNVTVGSNRISKFITKHVLKSQNYSEQKNSLFIAEFVILKKDTSTLTRL